MLTARFIFGAVFLSILLHGSSVLSDSSVTPTSQVYLPGTLGTWHVIAYLPGRALPKDCLSAWVKNQLNPNQKDAQFESTFFCIRKGWGSRMKIDVQKNLVRVPKSVGNVMQWNEIPMEGRLEMDPGWPARWFIGWVDYWIIEATPSELSTPDAYYVVSGPKKTVLVIFSRQPKMDEMVYDQIINRLQRLGYEQLSEKIIRLDR